MIPTLLCALPRIFPRLQDPATGYRIAMDCSEGASQMQEDLWQLRSKCIETRAAYRGVFKTFADLVLADAHLDGFLVTYNTSVPSKPPLIILQTPAAKCRFVFGFGQGLMYFPEAPVY